MKRILAGAAICFTLLMCAAAICGSTRTQPDSGSFTGVCCSELDSTEPECRVFSHGEPGKCRVALTFDDGPDPKLTTRILDILKENGVRATFFVVGKNAERYPALIDRIIAEGHEIGNHTYSHKYLGKAGARLTEKEISECDARIFEHSEYCTKFFRPPGGIMNAEISNVCSAYGYDVLLWSIDTMDWSGRSADGICREIFNNISDGSVILMHDGVRGHTAEALESVIPGLRAKGYEFVTASELLE